MYVSNVDEKVFLWDNVNVNCSNRYGILKTIFVCKEVLLTEMCTYVYVCIHTHMHVILYIYTYIYHREYGFFLVGALQASFESIHSDQTYIKLN
jgi:hypothetical protein